MDAPLIEIEDLKVHFHTAAGIIKAVDGVSFCIERGETLAVVGETGSGKSVTALSLLRLVGAGGISETARITGRIVFRPDPGTEHDLLCLSPAEIRSIRGRLISMIFQEPMTSLNPVYTVGDQIAEVIVRHQGLGRREALRIAAEMMELVRIPEAAARLKSLPHQLSGGMRQRVMIAMALACRPALLIADEPTTALDVTIQAQILDILQRLQREIRTSVLFITHDLGVVAQLADRVVVMYAGRAAETGTVDDIYHGALHPYTQSLLRSVPKPWRSGDAPERLEPIPGTVPNPAALPTGCAFHPRCTRPGRDERCRREDPGTERPSEGRSIRCWHWKMPEGPRHDA
ncbi:MAG: ABC transporter ATP-binding protein [Desulfobacterales bacterium]|nr:ABC transporter ATP-binding protein [Desulfobacterales bacterium]